MKYGRTRKEAKLDTENTFDDMIKQGPTKNAKWHMQRKAYTTCSYRKEKRLIGYSSVAEFYEERLKGGGTDGKCKTDK